MADVEFSGTTIPAGNGIVAFIGASNRDRHAHDDPDRLDLRRQVRQLTTFGGGAHLCNGHALARQELEVAVSTILCHCPDLKLETLDPPFRPTALMQGVASFPVSW